MHVPIALRKKNCHSPIKRPPFGLSNHVTVEVQPLKRSKNSGTKAVVMSRDLRPSKRLAFGKYN
jgi:hypothetical protein